MKKSELYKLIQEELQKQLKEQPTPKQTATGTETNPNTKLGGGFGGDGGNELEMEPEKGDPDGGYSAGGVMGCSNENVEPQMINNAYMDDSNSLSSYAGDPNNSWFSPTYNTFFNTNITGTETNTEYSNGTFITAAGSYCFGPFTIPNLWMCCVDGNTSDETTPYFNLSDNNPSINVMFNGYTGLWDNPLGYEPFEFNSGYVCYCHNPQVGADGGTLCRKDDDGNNIVPELADFIGITDSFFQQNDIDNPSQTFFANPNSVSPTITAMCIAGTEVEDGIQACIDDGNTPTGLPYASPYSGVPACNYIQNDGAVDVNGDVYNADETYVTLSQTDCDYGCFGCMDDAATNTNIASYLDGGTCLDIDGNSIDCTQDGGNCEYTGCTADPATNSVDQSEYAYNSCTGCGSAVGPWDYTDPTWGPTCATDECTGCNFLNYCGDEAAYNYVCNLNDPNLGFGGSAQDAVVAALCDPLTDYAQPNWDIGVFNMMATTDPSGNGKCLMDPNEEGYKCGDPNALNYDVVDGIANHCDGNWCCIYAFCNDPNAVNYAGELGHPGCGSGFSWEDAGLTYTNLEYMIWEVQVGGAQEHVGAVVDGGCIGYGVDPTLGTAQNFLPPGVNQVVFNGDSNSICKYEGCNDQNGIALAANDGTQTPGTPIGPGFETTDCDGESNYELFYHHPLNYGCQEYTAEGPATDPLTGQAILNTLNTDCCMRVGCTDPNASNYDENATVSMPNFNPLDSNALDGYDSSDLACIEDVNQTGLVPPGCEYDYQEGCTDEDAWNYDSTATDSCNGDNSCCMYVYDIKAKQICPYPPPYGCGITGAADEPRTFTRVAYEKINGEQREIKIGDKFYENITMDFVVGCPQQYVEGFGEACNEVIGPCVYPNTFSNCEFAEPGEDCDGNCTQGYIEVDGDCVLPNPGCTDPDACNYNIAFNIDDNSCFYADSGADCQGNCLEGYYMNSNGDCEEIVFDYQGCTCSSSTIITIDEDQLLSTFPMIPSTDCHNNDRQCGGNGVSEDNRQCKALYGGYCYPISTQNLTINGIDYAGQVQQTDNDLVMVWNDDGGYCSNSWGPWNTCTQNPKVYGHFGFPACKHDLDDDWDSVDIGCASYRNPHNEGVMKAGYFCSPDHDYAFKLYNGANEATNTPQNPRTMASELCNNFCDNNEYGGFQALGCPNSSACKNLCKNSRDVQGMGPYQWLANGACNG